METAEELYWQLDSAIDEAGEVPCHSAADLFFHGENERDNSQRIRYALKMCDSCPVKKLCAEYAIVAEEEFGVWGGTTPYSRTRLRRERIRVGRRVA